MAKLSWRLKAVAIVSARSRRVWATTNVQIIPIRNKLKTAIAAFTRAYLLGMRVGRLGKRVEGIIANSAKILIPEVY
jgi:hypothetical protein